VRNASARERETAREGERERPESRIQQERERGEQVRGVRTYSVYRQNMFSLDRIYSL
jgi:hypothetical protein